MHIPYERLQALLDSSLDVICSIDKEGRFIDVSKASYDLWGYNPEELKGKFYINMVLDEDRPKTVRAASDIMAGKDMTNFENRYTTRDGSIVPIVWSARFDSAQKIMYCVARNATEEKLAEKKVEEAERQKVESRVLFELFMKNSPLVAWITDIEGVMHYMNPIYLKTYGFSENDCGKSIFELFKPEEANDYFQNNLQVIYGGKAIGTLEPAHKADGSKQTLNVVKFPIYHSNVVMCGGWAIDITEQKNLQQELEASNSHKDKLLSVIAHDLRNPLSGCVSLLDIILSNYDAYSREELYQDLQLIQKQSSNSFNLLEELLLWARNQLNKVDYRPEQVDFEKEIKQTLELLHQQLTEKQISVSFDFKSFETIFCDANMFRTIVRNLVSNAIKFSPAGNCISIHAVQKADDIEFSIIDQGSGIDQNILNNILKGKSNHSTFGTKGEKGSGLGLHITKDFIERNGGKLWAVSVLGSGSTFFFNLPIFDHSKSNIYFSKEITI